VQSKWVRSEAGAALNDNKLIPLSAGAFDYAAIPPPFNLLHIVELGDKAGIKAALAAKLARVSPPAWKKLRYELLSWIGVVGGSITFAAHLQGFVQLSRIAKSLVDNWIAVLFVLWRNVLFFVPRVSETDALALSIIVFTANTLFLSPVVESKKAGKRSLSTELATALSFCVLLLVFALGIYASIGQHGMLYDLTNSAAALMGVELVTLNRLQQSILVVSLVMIALMIVLSAVIAFNAIANRSGPASHQAHVPAVSLRLHRIVIGTLCILLLSELEPMIAQWAR
jgi:hypothetical protein